MKVGILAGGLGSRITEETEVRPKPMVEIGGKPILWHIMRHYLRHGFDHFVVALGYKGEHIKRYMVDYHAYNDSNLTVDMHSGDVKAVNTATPLSESWTVDLIETGTSTETGARLKRIAPYLGDETFMLTYGDGVSDVDLSKLVEFHRSHGKLATMTVVHPPARFGRVELEGDQVVRFIEKPQFAGEHGPQVGEGWINGGFFVLEPRITEYIDDDDSTKWELAPLERLANDGELMAYRHYSFWQCMDTLRDKNMLEAMWNAGDPPWTI
ncbi:MAG TPA: glucose-1-phosphate cytidylyltransferase [Actinomycetota bacterium]